MGFTELAATRYPIEPRSHDYTVWDTMDSLTLKQIDGIWDLVKQSPTFWLDLKPLVSGEELDRIWFLGRGADVYFVTSRVGDSARRQTQEWLIGHGISRPTVLISGRKGEIAKALKAGWCIDDKAGNAVAVSYLSPDTKSFLIDRPYNQLNPDVIGGKVRRVQTVSGFLDEVERG